MSEATKPAVTIEYCVPCGYATRAAWLALELLEPFQDTISSLTLVPGAHGILEVRVDNDVVYSDKTGTIPQVAQLVEGISRFTGPVEYKG